MSYLRVFSDANMQDFLYGTTIVYIPVIWTTFPILICHMCQNKVATMPVKNCHLLDVVSSI